MLDLPTALFLLAEVIHRLTPCHLSFSLLSVFLVIHYRPIVEELADIILSADIETVRAIQHRYGEQVTFDVASPACVHCLC